MRAGRSLCRSVIPSERTGVRHASATPGPGCRVHPKPFRPAAGGKCAIAVSGHEPIAFLQVVQAQYRLSAASVHFAGANQSFEGASPSRQGEDCRSRAWSEVRKPGALHNGVWELCGHDAPPISAFVGPRRSWDVPSTAGSRGRAQLVGPVTKWFDWIGKVQAKVASGVENETHKLERRRDRGRCRVEA